MPGYAEDAFEKNFSDTNEFKSLSKPFPREGLIAYWQGSLRTKASNLGLLLQVMRKLIDERP